MDNSSNGFKQELMEFNLVIVKNVMKDAKDAQDQIPISVFNVTEEHYLIQNCIHAHIVMS